MEIQWHRQQQLEQERWRTQQTKQQHTDWTDHAAIEAKFKVRFVTCRHFVFIDAVVYTFSHSTP